MMNIHYVKNFAFMHFSFYFHVYIVHADAAHNSHLTIVVHNSSIRSFLLQLGAQ
jgi:hypothetical protein